MSGHNHRRDHRHPHPTAERHGAAARSPTPRRRSAELNRKAAQESRRRKMKVEELQRNGRVNERNEQLQAEHDRLTEELRRDDPETSGRLSLPGPERGAALRYMGNCRWSARCRLQLLESSAGPCTYSPSSALYCSVSSTYV